MIILYFYICINFPVSDRIKDKDKYDKRGKIILDNIDDRVKNIALKLRKIRELKGLTREKFCEPLGENSEYWGLIERGEQAISLVKLLQVCETYDIPIETVVDLDYQTMNDKALRAEISDLLESCKGKQLEMIKKFVEDIAMAL